MRRIKQIGTMVSILVALFLFFYSVSVFASSRNYLLGQGISISKSGKLPVSPNTQSPFEENQSETGNEFQDSFSLICLPEETLSLIPIIEFSFIHQASRPDNITARIPIYLAARSLLI